MNERDLSQLVERITDQVVADLSRGSSGMQGSGNQSSGGDQDPYPYRWLTDPLNDTNFRCARCTPNELLQEAPDRVGTLPLGEIPGEPAFANAMESLAGLIDHTLLKPDATPENIETLCHEAVEYGFKSVCVNPSHVRHAAQVVGNSGVKVCAVVGFPLGATLTDVKAFETKRAIEEGASEIDMVLPIGMLKAGRHGYVAHDILEVVRAAGPNVITKVILETCLLSDEEKIVACRLSKEAGACFVKTSTGFSSGGATAEDVRLMRREVGSALGVKASGGMRSTEDALRMVRSGANRIGASASVAIAQGAPASPGAPSAY